MKAFSKTKIAAAALLLAGTLAFAKQKEMTVLHTGTGTQLANHIPDEETPGHWATITELIEQQGRKFGLLHNWGASWGSITRIQKQSGRSNFVWNDQLVGAYYEMTTNNFLVMGRYINVDLFARNAVYYPYAYTFNKVKQVTTQTILYGIDFFTGVKFSMNFWNWVTFSAKPGMHVYYQIHDKWHYVHLGAGLALEAELPISSRWSFNVGGIFTWDNANLGTNRQMRPFDFCWQYQAQLGFRYSKRKLNRKSFVPYVPRPPKTKHVRALKPRKNKDDAPIGDAGDVSASAASSEAGAAQEAAATETPAKEKKGLSKLFNKMFGKKNKKAADAAPAAETTE